MQANKKNLNIFLPKGVKSESVPTFYQKILQSNDQGDSKILETWLNDNTVNMTIADNNQNSSLEEIEKEINNFVLKTATDNIKLLVKNAEGITAQVLERTQFWTPTEYGEYQNGLANYAPASGKMYGSDFVDFFYMIQNIFQAYINLDKQLSLTSKAVAMKNSSDIESELIKNMSGLSSFTIGEDSGDTNISNIYKMDISYKAGKKFDFKLITQVMEISKEFGATPVFTYVGFNPEATRRQLKLFIKAWNKNSPNNQITLQWLLNAVINFGIDTSFANEDKVQKYSENAVHLLTILMKMGFVQSKKNNPPEAVTIGRVLSAFPASASGIFQIKSTCAVAVDGLPSCLSHPYAAPLVKVLADQGLIKDSVVKAYDTFIKCHTFIVSNWSLQGGKEKDNKNKKTFYNRQLKNSIQINASARLAGLEANFEKKDLERTFDLSVFPSAPFTTKLFDKNFMKSVISYSGAGDTTDLDDTFEELGITDAVEEKKKKNK